MTDTSNPPELWALVLAGGDGRRLQELTRRLAGRPIPKQYCRIAGDRSMLEATLDRIAPLVPRERTLVIVNRDHLDLARSQLAGLPPENMLVQPSNRDTGPGLLWSLLALERRAPGALLATLPSDHYIADDSAFRECVRRTADVIDERPGKLGLIGIRPEEPSPEYGYVLPATRLAAERTPPVFEVAAFAEKPPRARARAIVRQGGLWNSFVMVFRTARMLELLSRVRPRDHDAMRALASDAAALERHYASLEPWNFSTDFLSRVVPELLVLQADGLGWSDWGTPRSIERTFAAMNVVPPWLAAPPARAERTPRSAVA
ncbi:MAG TPA: sugar phosphate nucleotidyltransferase [Candidatus Binatia bacterium]